MRFFRNVVEKLRSSVVVQPESFDCATIMFSDVHGFGDYVLSAQSADVVSMLNFIYTLFDEILTAYDVYKVETIGEVYMVGMIFHRSAPAKRAIPQFGHL